MFTRSARTDLDHPPGQIVNRDIQTIGDYVKKVKKEEFQAPAEGDGLPTTEAGWLHRCNQRFAEGYEKGLAAQRHPGLPIERDEEMDRDYIPLPGGWELQTKGKGSTLRLLDKKAGKRHPLPLPDFIIGFIERMAREVNAASNVQPKGTPGAPQTYPPCKGLTCRPVVVSLEADPIYAKGGQP